MEERERGKGEKMGMQKGRERKWGKGRKLGCRRERERERMGKGEKMGDAKGMREKMEERKWESRIEERKNGVKGENGTAKGRRK